VIPLTKQAQELTHASRKELRLMLEVQYRSVLVGSETKGCNQLLHLKPSSHGPSEASIVIETVSRSLDLALAR
jgi:hypothetical protein